ncbi:MAG TPA: PAS domain-containing sensor histidine kinase, partial [Rhodospirillales bacterium]|nr:PAS domain-containing sensor histidine kinase [Rhodospirillales bacterium]
RAITTKTRDGGMVIVWSDISQFKKISNDLARREKHLRGILDTVPDAIITINEKGIIDTFNPAAERMFGYQARDVIGKNIKKLMPQPYRREHDGYLLEFLKTGKARVIGIGSEVIGRRKDGSTFAMDLSVSEGDHLGEKMFIGVADDITERKLAEQALRRSEQDLRSILNNLRDGFFRVDMGGFITMASPSATKLTGYSIKQLIGKKISDIFIDPGEQKGFFAALRENAGNATEYEVQIHQKNGKQIWGGINSRLIFDDQGQPVGIEGIARDVTQRKTAEAALILSEERLALAMEASREGLWDWNMETNAVNISARMEQMLAIKDKSKVSAKTLQKLVHDDDVEHFRAALVAHLKENTAAFECEFRYYDKNKNIGWMRNRGIALRNPDGRAYRMIGSIDDITRRKQDEEALRDALEQAEIANRTKTDFLANISHELRTPLNAIIGFSDLINSEIFGPIGVEKYKDYTQTIAESGHHLLDIINDILDIARIEVGKLDFRPEPVDLENVIQSCLRLIAERAEKGGLSLRRNVQGGLPTVNADPRRLKQIFLNLLTNAVKFTPRGGTVTLRARMTKAGTLAISISDSGIGMKSDDIPKVMTPFVQVDSKLSRAYEGTGLGLPLTKLFVELHGGDMSIKSSPGTGTTVTVYLPNSILLN